MRKFKILTKTAKGEKALRKNIDDQKKLPAHQRFTLAQMFRRTINEDPLSLTIEVKNSFLAQQLRSNDVLSRLKESMDEEGVQEFTDYEVIIFE